MASRYCGAGIHRQCDAVGIPCGWDREVAVVLAAITVVILLTMLALLAAGPIMRLIGERLEAMITRILGVILAALAAQLVIDGISRAFRDCSRVQPTARKASQKI